MAGGKTGRDRMEAHVAKAIADSYFNLDTSSEVDPAAGTPPKGKGKGKKAAPAPEPTPAPPPAKQKLTAREALFIEEYLKDLNATQAAIRAGYSKATARQIGYENLTKPYIRAAIEAAKRDQLERVQMDADALLFGLVQDYHANIADLFDENGDFRPVEEWPLAFQRGLVQGVEIEALFEGHGEDRTQIGLTKKIKLADRTRIKELLGKHIQIQAWNLKKTITHQVDPFDEIRAQLQGTGLRPTIEGTSRNVTETPKAAGSGFATLRPRG